MQDIIRRCCGFGRTEVEEAKGVQVQRKLSRIGHVHDSRKAKRTLSEPANPGVPGQAQLNLSFTRFCCVILLSQFRLRHEVHG